MDKIIKLLELSIQNNLGQAQLQEHQRGRVLGQEDRRDEESDGQVGADRS